MANSVVWPELWESKLQERLNKPTNWKEICEVVLTDTKVLHRPYETLPSVQTGTRGSAYTFQDITSTDDNVNISTYENLPVLIDRADLAQQSFYGQASLAEYQGRLIDERLETLMLADHASWTNFGTSDIDAGGASTDPITVTVANVDDVIRGVLQKIETANGIEMLRRYGAFIVWRSADFNKLRQVMQANGFNAADEALRSGGEIGVEYMGVKHYLSTSHATGHLMAGVRKGLTLGLCRSTWGKIVELSEPAGSSGGNVSGIGVVSRVDYKFKLFNNMSTLVYDINVA